MRILEIVFIFLQNNLFHKNYMTYGIQGVNERLGKKCKMR